MIYAVLNGFFLKNKWPNFLKEALNTVQFNQKFDC